MTGVQTCALPILPFSKKKKVELLGHNFKQKCYLTKAKGPLIREAITDVKEQSCRCSNPPQPPSLYVCVGYVSERAAEYQRERQKYDTGDKWRQKGCKREK